MVSLKIFAVSLLTGAVSAQGWWPGRPTPTPVAPTPVAPAAPGATQSLYGQCGGETYTGLRACPTGAFCKPSNQWYSQCVAIENIQGQPGEVRTLTTVFSYDVGGQNPREISTRITYVVPTPGAVIRTTSSSRTTSAPVEVVTLTLTPDEPCDHEYWCQKKK